MISENSIDTTRHDCFEGFLTFITFIYSTKVRVVSNADLPL